MQRLNQRLLMQDFMEQLSSERATVEKLAAYYHPVKDSSKALRAIRTDKRVFDRLSKNALQNVMVFFDYKGADFLKMRCICKKTNNAYMQELKKRFNAERQFEKLNQDYLTKAQTGVTSFIQSCLPIADKAPDCKKMEPSLQIRLIGDDAAKDQGYRPDLLTELKSLSAGKEEGRDLVMDY